jgi:hypothetical protein
VEKNQIEVDKNIETISQETIQITKDIKINIKIKIKEIINKLDSIDHVIIDNNNIKGNIVSQDNIDKQTHKVNKEIIEIIANIDSIDSKDNQDNIEVAVIKGMIIKDIKEIIIITSNKDSKNKNMIIDFCQLFKLIS